MSRIVHRETQKMAGHDIPLRVLSTPADGEYKLEVSYKKSNIKEFFSSNNPDPFKGSRSHEFLQLHSRDSVMAVFKNISWHINNKTPLKKQTKEQIKAKKLTCLNAYYVDNTIRLTSKDSVVIKPHWKKLEIRYQDRYRRSDMADLYPNRFRSVEFPENSSLQHLLIHSGLDIEGDPPKDCKIDIFCYLFGPNEPDKYLKPYL